MQPSKHYRVPLTRPSLPPVEEVGEDLRQMLKSGCLTNFGPFVREFERRAAEYLGVPYAASVSSATTGLCLLLNTLKCGSEVVLPSFTFPATAQAVIWNRLVPRFADIDPESFCVSVESVKKQITRRTSAILGVHAFGAPCRTKELEGLARTEGLALFFDSAHAFGSKHCGKFVGTFGDAEVFSFSATKVLAGSDGGIVTTSRSDIFQSIMNRRNYGLNDDRNCVNMGLNGKMSEFSAALCTRGLSQLEHNIELRSDLARTYKAQLSNIPGITFQVLAGSDISTYKDFTILVDPLVAKVNRDILASELRRKGIEVGTYFWPPLHRLDYFRIHGSNAILPNTDLVASRILSLPMYAELTEDDVQFVIGSIREVLC
jgi:dTDP-4-amino-4,6-dideoxygalactose transaminase